MSNGKESPGLLESRTRGLALLPMHYYGCTREFKIFQRTSKRSYDESPKGENLTPALLSGGPIMQGLVGTDPVVI